MITTSDLLTLVGHLIVYRDKCREVIDRDLEIRLIECIDYILTDLKDFNEERKTP